MAHLTTVSVWLVAGFVGDDFAASVGVDSVLLLAGNAVGVTHPTALAASKAQTIIGRGRIQRRMSRKREKVVRVAVVNAYGAACPLVGRGSLGVKLLPS